VVLAAHLRFLVCLCLLAQPDPGFRVFRALFAPYDRIPLWASITPEPSDLRWLILAPPVSFASRFELTSGWVKLYEAFGATEQEGTYAREHGGDKLVEILTRVGGFPVTDPRRKSAVSA
jgi:Suppressor of fused protein (SUFU)